MWIASSYIVLTNIIQSKFDYEMKFFNVKSKIKLYHLSVLKVKFVQLILLNLIKRSL